MNTYQTSHAECALLQALPRGGAGYSLHEFARADESAAPRNVYGIGVRITCIDRAIIRRYFHEYREAFSRDQTDGRQRRGKLPRFWSAGGKLPAGLRTKQLPAELERRLSALDAANRRVAVPGAVLLIETATRRIVDVMPDARMTADQSAARESAAMLRPS